MDQYDRASELEDYQREQAIIAAKVQHGHAHARLRPVGRCHYCDEATTRLFCNPECRDGYDAEQRAKTRNRGTQPWN